MLHTRYLASHVTVFLVYRFVFTLILRAHIPVEAILEARCVRIVVNLFKLWLISCESFLGLYEVCFGLGNEPVRDSRGDIGVFLVVTKSQSVMFRQDPGRVRQGASTRRARRGGFVLRHSVSQR